MFYIMFLAKLDGNLFIYVPDKIRQTKKFSYAILTKLD